MADKCTIATMQINIQGLSLKSNKLIEKYVYDNNIDIIAIQETKGENNLNIDNYKTFYMPSMGLSGL